MAERADYGWVGGSWLGGRTMAGKSSILIVTVKLLEIELTT